MLCTLELFDEDYQQKHPEVTVLDPPCAIQRIYNRQSMLQGIADINLADCDDTTSSANEVAEEWWAWERITKLTGTQAVQHRHDQRTWESRDVFYVIYIPGKFFSSMEFSVAQSKY
ncbi:unnamed protein product [Arabidopsis thaliana]|uniref:(thale cress) hypothetical protein n=1 Tax=Arabidopsis thaliana TaxID=3702 RepID=A0A7G2E8H1_ARATH|nr:unnamed protein product [Arabidopsis thaliana]